MIQQREGGGSAGKRSIRTGTIRVLAACAALGLAATFIIDRYQLAERERRIAVQHIEGDPATLAAPNPADWRGRTLELGAEAPDFRLVEVPGGRAVSLRDFRGQPVVLVLSSFG
jgi:hypothetical protein